MYSLQEQECVFGKPRRMCIVVMTVVKSLHVLVLLPTVEIVIKFMSSLCCFKLLACAQC